MITEYTHGYATCGHRAEWVQAYELRDAGAVLHSHSSNAVLATLLHPNSPEFECTHLEMIKGIVGHGFHDKLRIPIIENTARECELTDRMRAAMLAYPKATAVLVRRHGVYVWGKSWIEAKTQAECYDYLFGLAIRMAGMGIDAAAAPMCQMGGGHGRLVNGHSPTMEEGALLPQELGTYQAISEESLKQSLFCLPILCSTFGASPE
jgi:methylthioribulose 1-phosphate dehydratase / enolase-phosphatase E1